MHRRRGAHRLTMRAGDRTARLRLTAFTAALAGLAGLAGCAQPLVPVEQAEQICASEVRTHAMRAEPRLSMGVGIASGGRTSPHAGLSVSMSPERIPAADTAEAFNRCVMQRSGRMPRYPLAGYPDLRG